MRILITGSSGFIGVNLLRHMAEIAPSADIIAADLCMPSAEDQLILARSPARISYQPLDVRDDSGCSRLMENVRPTHILHAAAVTSAGDTTASKMLIQSVNVEGTVNLLGAATRVGSVKRCILLSSSALYMQGCDSKPCDEEHALDLSESYARTKREMELLMAEYEDLGGFPILSARIGPVYGPQERSSSTRPGVSMIQRILDLLFEDKMAYIEGRDVQRDWTHAEDIARGLEALLFTDALNHRIYNVSTGISVAASTIIQWCIEHGLKVCWTARHAGADITLKARDTRKPLVITRLQRDTGFTPKFAIDEGLADVVSARCRYSATLNRWEGFAQ